MVHPKHRIPAKVQQKSEKKSEKSSKNSGLFSHNYEIGAFLLVVICGFIIYRGNGLSMDKTVPKLTPETGSKGSDEKRASSPATDSAETIYTSSDKIHHLFKYDFDISKQIIPIIRQSKTLSTLMKSSDMSFEKLSAVLKPPFEDPLVIYHPINQYFVLYKFCRIWPKVNQLFHSLIPNQTAQQEQVWKIIMASPSTGKNDMTWQTALKKVFEFGKALRMLTVPELDLKKSALGVLRLQELYELDVTDLRLGNIRGHPAVRSINEDEMDVFIDAATMYNDKCRALAWTLEKSRFLSSQYNLTVDVQMTPEDRAVCEKKFCVRGDRCIDEKRWIEVNYANLCRDPETYSKPDPTLKCGYWQTWPQFYIQPIKVEWLYKRPPVLVLHNIFTPSEMDELWDDAPPQARGQLVTDKVENKFSETRTATTAWLGDESKIAKKLSTRVGLAINKSMDTADRWQLGNYGIGGQYYFHADYFEDRFLPQQFFYEWGWGNRLVTFMAYLNDVQEGGHTAFPVLNISVTPEKGSALVWHNMFSDGPSNPQTYHGGCPVLIGNKKIANKWIHYGGQVLTSPCMPSSNKDGDHNYLMI